MSSISVVIAVSKGEEVLLKDCVSSVLNFADEIIIFDLGANINGLKNVKIIKHKPVDYIEPIRNKMINACSNKWIFILDPDERLTDELKNELEKIIKKNIYDVINIPRKNIFFGKWIAHTNWWPDRQYRFFKRKSISWPNEIHTYPEIIGKSFDLPANEKLAIIHFGYDNLYQFIERQIRYSEIEARNLYSKSEKFSLYMLLYAPFRNFIARYIIHRGYLDGFWGFSLSFLTSIFSFATWINLWHLEQNQTKD